MKKTHIAIAGIAVLGILALVTVARGIGGGVAAAEDERFRINGTTLTRYLGTDTFVSIPDAVTNIGEEAFSDNATLTRLEIPDSVTTISYNAFKNCTALIGVIIPDSVTKVGPGAFEGCTSLTSVEIGENVSSWGTGVFTNCDSLAKVSVDRDNEYLTYYNGAIYNGNMTMLYQVLPAREGDNYVMPDTVRNIDAYAFWNLMNTKNVMISAQVDKIPKYALTNMGTVENVIIQDPTAGIGERAFANNAALRQVAIPASVTSIDQNAFAGSPEMKIYTQRSTTADAFGQDHNIQVIYEAAYPVDFMDSNVGLEEKPNVGEGSDNTVSEAEDTNGASTEEQSQTDEDGEESQSSTNDFQSTDGYIHPLDVPEPDDVIGKTVIVAGDAVFLMNNHEGQVYGMPDESVIPQRTYYKQKSLTSYEIDETINRIGRLAFAESGLTSIVIPDSVTEIEYGAFLSCTSLADVVISNSVSDIGTKAFEGTAWLNNWLSGETGDDGDFLIVGDGFLLAYRGNEEHVEIPDGVKKIGAEVFKGHTEILDVSIPASVTKICAEAFRNCSSLTRLTGCEGLETIVRGAFYGTQISESELN